MIKEPNKAQIYCLCRRLRAGRTKATSPEQYRAFEQALKIVIDELFLHESYHYYFYGDGFPEPEYKIREKLGMKGLEVVK